jgi:hypothetical protein
MNTYIKTPEFFAAVRASRAQVARLPQVVTGCWAIVPATRQLREDAKFNTHVKVLRVLSDNSVGYL